MACAGLPKLKVFYRKNTDSPSHQLVLLFIPHHRLSTGALAWTKPWEQCHIHVRGAHCIGVVLRSVRKLRTQHVTQTLNFCETLKSTHSNILISHQSLYLLTGKDRRKEQGRQQLPSVQQLWGGGVEKVSDLLLHVHLLLYRPDLQQQHQPLHQRNPNK